MLKTPIELIRCTKPFLNRGTRGRVYAFRLIQREIEFWQGRLERTGDPVEEKVLRTRIKYLEKISANDLFPEIESYDKE